MSGKRSPFGGAAWLPSIAAVLAIGSTIILAAIALTIPAQPEEAHGIEAVARSIGTPPWPVPNWIAFLYPWQSLFGGLLALLAAVVGAIVLQGQSDAARQNLLTELEHQRDQEARRRLNENDLRASEQEEHKKRLAGALSGELRSWVLRFRDLQLLDVYSAVLGTAENGVPPVIPVYPIYIDRFPIFEAVCSQIGLFSGRTPHDISVVYTALRSVLDTLRGIREGDYSFLNAPPPAEAEVWQREMNGRGECPEFRARRGVLIIRRSSPLRTARRR